MRPLRKIKPKALKKGDTIAVIAPAKWTEESELARACAYFEQAGYKIRLGSTNYLRYGQFAGTPRERALELEEMFGNPQIKAIFCARGGYSSVQVSEQLDYRKIKAHPKIFVGFSDITALLLSIQQKTGLVTFHGPMLFNFKSGLEPKSFDTLLGVLGGKIKNLKLAGSGLKGRIINPGRARGILLGGNLTILVDRLGTKDDLQTDGALLLIEDTKEPYYKIHRMLEHLRRAGKLKRVKGLIVGEMTDFPPDEIPFGQSVDEIVQNALEGRKIPLVSDTECGHGRTLLTLPLGIECELNAKSDGAQLNFLEAAVS